MAVCPVHALARIMKTRTELGLTEKHPLFPQRNGSASTAKGVYQKFSALLSLHITEHSFRRAGAQYFARRGVAIGVIQYLGRWGSETVYRYVGDAMDARTKHASRQAAEGSYEPTCRPEVCARLEDAIKIINELKGCGLDPGGAERIVARAVEAAQKAAWDACSAVELRLAEKLASVKGAVKPVGRAANRAHTHKIALGEGCYPSSLWTTACGWRFGNVPRVRVGEQEIDCASCARCGSV